MSFADDLRKVKPQTSQSKKISGVQYMRQMITAEDIKAACTAAAARGERYAVIQKDNFYTDYGTDFYVDFRKKAFFNVFKSSDEDLIRNAVSNTLGVKASQLGLSLDSVRSKYSSNCGARSSYIISARFSW